MAFRDPTGHGLGAFSVPTGARERMRRDAFFGESHDRLSDKGKKAVVVGVGKEHAALAV
jgi:hypothetical protein